MKVSHLSEETILIPVQEIVGGIAVDMTASPVQIAFVPDATDPVEADWLPASWEVNLLSGDFDAKIIVGPGSGTITFAKNQHRRPWVRITTPDERPVLKSPGMIRVS